MLLGLREISSHGLFGLGFLRQDFSEYPWLSWNSLLIRLASNFQVLGTRGVHHHLTGDFFCSIIMVIADEVEEEQGSGKAMSDMSKWRIEKTNTEN